MLTPKIGVGYRSALAPWIETCPAEVECLEITAGDFYKGGQKRIHSLADRYPLIVRGGGLSLGTPGPVNAYQLERFTSVVAAADPLWISEPLGFSRTTEVELFSPNPVCPSQESLDNLVDHVWQVMERCRKPLILENISSHLRISESMSETELFNRLCERTGCGILLDVTSLLVNSQNHGFDPCGWSRELDTDRIVQLHVAGYSYQDGRWEDDHRNRIQDDLWKLVWDVLHYARPKAITIEWDRDFPAVTEIERELGTLREGVRQMSVPPEGTL